MGFLIVRWKNALLEVSNNRVHSTGSEVDAHDLVEFGFNAGLGEILHVDNSFPFGVYS